MSERKTVSDDLGRNVRFSFPPQRIISLCPSITETLFDLGLEEQMVGRTRYCIHPQALVKDVKTVGGTKKIKEAAVAELRPDLIIAEKEENPKALVESLESEFPVYVTEVKTYEDGLKMIMDLGEITDRKIEARDMVEAIKKKFIGLRDSSRLSVAYMIWQNPYMVAGNDTYIDSMLKKAGFTNSFSHREERYPTVTLDDIRAAKPDFIFLSSEPFPFDQTHKDEWESLVPESKVVLVNGEICWYGSRMLKAADELKRWSTL